MPVTVSPVSFEHHREPLGIGEPRPRLSWKTTADPGWTQERYEIEVTDASGAGSSRVVFSPDSVLVPWPGKDLTSQIAVSVRVRVWGAGTEIPSEWSPATTAETGILEASGWTAHAISPAWAEDADTLRRPPLMRRDFTLPRPVHSARLYVTAHGLYEIEINGRRIGKEALAPGWTVYGERLRYATYDVTENLVAGPNAIGSWLADGWYRGRLGFHGGHQNLYGTDIALLAQLHITHDDGSSTVIASDESWRASFGPILTTGLYEGEAYDAREEARGWSSPGFDDTAWSPVRVVPRDPSTLVAPEGPPVRCTEELAPVAVTTSPSGTMILDFGQNLVGRLRVRLSGLERGQEIRLRHAEVLEDGELCTRPLRGAASTDTYIAGDDSDVEWEPRFTIHGFRYAELTGWSGDDPAAAVTARVYHTDMERTGWFECSDADVNRLHENVRWSMRGNFVDIPTDCPQRDERLGWTGDLQVFAPTATFLYDCSGMLGSWLKDVAVEQLEDGTVPWYVPVIPGGEEWTPIQPGAVWGDVAVLTPWTLYQRFGDTGVLATQYSSAKAWVDLMAERSGESYLWNTGMQLGDWLDPAAPPHDPADATTDRYLVSTAYFAWSTQHLAQMASVLGNTTDELHYRELARKVRDAFAREYISPSGRVVSDAQTAYALVLAFGLASTEEQEQRSGERLAELVGQAGNRIATGFAGTPLVTDALTSVGEIDTAYALLMERQCPSWLYAVGQGATTIWERWDSMLPDGSINPGEMTSFNHYALGAVADWMHRVVAGLAPAEPGYRSILFRPRPGGGITSAQASHETPYGLASISWTVDAGALSAEVTVPTGCTAVVDLPGQSPVTVQSGTHAFSNVAVNS
ncbi:MAG: alpha-L-rhamnosidase [Micrococcaceae bacterium]|jgi:alpha-L-rhamnosidase|nr:alpha-L-rhamnosidase [Micrococcaceae bacterium]